MNTKPKNAKRNHPLTRKGQGLPRDQSGHDTDMPVAEFECKDCGSDFAISAKEVRFFQSRGLQIPKRCKKCRGKGVPETQTAPSMQNKFFRDADSTRIPMVPWRHV